MIRVVLHKALHVKLVLYIGASKSLFKLVVDFLEAKCLCVCVCGYVCFSAPTYLYRVYLYEKMNGNMSSFVRQIAVCR